MTQPRQINVEQCCKSTIILIPFDLYVAGNGDFTACIAVKSRSAVMFVHNLVSERTKK
jgi:hypothetical protein